MTDSTYKHTIHCDYCDKDVKADTHTASRMIKDSMQGVECVECEDVRLKKQMDA